MDIKLIRKLLIRLCTDGDLSVCETCIYDESDEHCHYGLDGRCNDDNLAHYEPSKNRINS